MRASDRDLRTFHKNISNIIFNFVLGKKPQKVPEKTSQTNLQEFFLLPSPIL